MIAARQLLPALVLSTLLCQQAAVAATDDWSCAEEIMTQRSAGRWQRGALPAFVHTSGTKPDVWIFRDEDDKLYLREKNEVYELKPQLSQALPGAALLLGDKPESGKLELASLSFATPTTITDELAATKASLLLTPGGSTLFLHSPVKEGKLSLFVREQGEDLSYLESRIKLFQNKKDASERLITESREILNKLCKDAVGKKNPGLELAEVAKKAAALLLAAPVTVDKNSPPEKKKAEETIAFQQERANLEQAEIAKLEKLQKSLEDSERSERPPVAFEKITEKDRLRALAKYAVKAYRSQTPFEKLPDTDRKALEGACNDETVVPKKKAPEGLSPVQQLLINGASGGLPGASGN